MIKPYTVSFSPLALRQIQRERTWLHNHRGLSRALAFEAELRHRLDLVADNPELGPPSEREDERRTYLSESGFHVFYLVNHKRCAIRVVRIRHHAQRPLKG
jgi:plasmid stabilization system protein ParE